MESSNLKDPWPPGEGTYIERVYAHPTVGAMLQELQNKVNYLRQELDKAKEQINALGGTSNSVRK